MYEPPPKERRIMAKVWDLQLKKYVEVRNLKNITFPWLPGFEFFLHKTHGWEGYTVSEKTSGAAVCMSYSREFAIIRAEALLKKKGKKRLKKAIAEAIAKIKEE